MKMPASLTNVTGSISFATKDSIKIKCIIKLSKTNFYGLIANDFS